MGSFTIVTAESIRATTAVNKKSQFINAANDYINSKQWPGKAAIRRLKDNELVQYTLWLDYLDALYVVDTSNPPDIVRPEKPI